MVQDFPTNCMSILVFITAKSHHRALGKSEQVTEQMFACQLVGPAISLRH